MEDYIDNIIDNVHIYKWCNICRNDCMNGKNYIQRDCREELRETIKGGVIEAYIRENAEK